MAFIMKSPSKNNRYIYVLLLAGVITLGILSFWSPDSSEERHRITPGDSTISKESNEYRIVFYNVENLFDTKDNPYTKDEEFLPDGDRHWTSYKYRQKLKNIYQVIVAIGGWNPPIIIGLCEVENREVLNDLIKSTPLSRHAYTIVHHESPDHRGIDVALLYRSKKFKLLDKKFIPVKFPFNPSLTTRDILYAKGMLPTQDTIHFFVNHWPSRYGGRLESQPKRVRAAKILKNHIRALQDSTYRSKIIVMGDFNDEPRNKSIKEILNAGSSFHSIKPGNLYNLSGYLQEQKNTGSYKYKGHWNMLDQFIVSGACLTNSEKIHIGKNEASVFRPKFLLEKDNHYVGYKPFRTYLGYRYNGGFSDHLPIYLDLRQPLQ
jgi:predicted extracellular nuclease